MDGLMEGCAVFYFSFVSEDMIEIMRAAIGKQKELFYNIRVFNGATSMDLER